MAAEARLVITAVAAHAATAFVNAAVSGLAVTVHDPVAFVAAPSAVPVHDPADLAIAVCGRAAARDTTDPPDYLEAGAVRRDLIAAPGTAAVDVIRSWAHLVSAAIPGRCVGTASEVAVQQDATEAHASIRVFARRTVVRVAIVRRIASRRFFAVILLPGFTGAIIA